MMTQETTDLPVEESLTEVPFSEVARRLRRAEKAGDAYTDESMRLAASLMGKRRVLTQTPEERQESARRAALASNAARFRPILSYPCTCGAGDVFTVSVPGGHVTTCPRGMHLARWRRKGWDPTARTYADAIRNAHPVAQTTRSRARFNRLPDEATIAAILAAPVLSARGKDYYTPQQVAEVLALLLTTVLGYLRDGRMPYYLRPSQAKEGGVVGETATASAIRPETALIERSDLEAALTERRAQQAAREGSTHTASVLALQKDLLTIAEAADLFQISDTSIRNYIRQGRLQTRRYTGRIYLHRNDLLALLEPVRSR